MKPKVGNFSLAKAILASLWKIGEGNRTSVIHSRYCRLLCSDKHPTTARTAISRLISDGYIVNNANSIFSLTEKGREKALNCFVDAEVAMHKQVTEVKNWDGGWRIIIFDIPESKRRHRDGLRQIISGLGFKEVQKSIWAYPYPVPQFIKNILSSDNIKPHVRFIAADNIENDGDLKKMFNLN